VWRFASGKLRRSYDESAEAAAELQRHGGEALRLEPIDFGRRLAIEKELVADEEVCCFPTEACFSRHEVCLHVQRMKTASRLRCAARRVAFSCSAGAW